MNDNPIFPRPIVVVSRCLGIDPCRYDGDIVEAGFVGQLARFARVVPVCPELEIGLGVPRDPIRLVADEGAGVRLVQPASGRDLTDAMAAFAERWLGKLDAVDGFILKSRSPSCGITDTKVLRDAESEDIVAVRSGMFAAAVRERFPAVAVEDESRLEKETTWALFLERVFTNACNREGVIPDPRSPFPSALL